MGPRVASWKGTTGPTFPFVDGVAVPLTAFGVGVATLALLAAGVDAEDTGEAASFGMVFCILRVELTTCRLMVAPSSSFVETATPLIALVSSFVSLLRFLFGSATELNGDGDAVDLAPSKSRQSWCWG